jgi:hypothetical protein
MVHGSLSGVVLPDISSWSDDPTFDFAAAALGGAAEKGDYLVSGPVSLDLVVYFNRILDIPNDSNLAKLEGDGIEGADGEWYLDFFEYNSYDREDKYPGCAIYFDASDPDSGYHTDTIMNLVFGTGFEAGNIYGFAVAADDSRRVIAFAHDTDSVIVREIDAAGENCVCADTPSCEE